MTLHDHTPTDKMDRSSADAADGFSLSTALHVANIWRQQRPLIGAILLAIGGWFVMKPMVGASFTMVVHMGMRGASPYLLGGIMILAAVVAVITPAQRHFPALIAMACSVLSLPFANLGGFILGMFFGIIGSGMVFAWTPYSDKQLANMQARHDRRQAGRAAG